LKKLPNTLDAMAELPPFVPVHGGFGEVAVGGFRDINGILAPEVSSTASCFR
jgi:hypothetical protein